MRHVLANFMGEGEGETSPDLPRYTLKDLNLLGLQQNLKKRDLPYLLPISRVNSRQLESELFARSYKSVTDLVTKWLWPTPAFWTVRACVRLVYGQIRLRCSVLCLQCLLGLPFGMATMAWVW